MARAKGQVVEKQTKRGTVFALRFPACGARQYVTLGTAADGWSRPAAEQALQDALTDVRRGVWVHPDEKTDALPPTTFGALAEEWLAHVRVHGTPKVRQLRDATLTAYKGDLRRLGPKWVQARLDDIDVAFIDAWRDQQVRQVGPRRWSPATINSALTRAGQVLDRAVRHKLLAANPMRAVAGMKVANEPKERSWIGPLDAQRLLAAVPPPASPSTKFSQPTAMRRALLACMVLGGLRIGEAFGLWWGDVDLAAGRIEILDAKTRAGQRRVAIGHELRTLLGRHKPVDAALDAHVFTNLHGQPFEGGAGRSWAHQMLRSTVTAAGLVDGRGQPLALSPHSLRRSYISIALMGGANPRWVMRQVGHASAELTLSVYAQVVEGEKPSPAELEACAALLGNGEKVPDVQALVPETQ